jgi:hypothetical protein
MMATRLFAFNKKVIIRNNGWLFYQTAVMSIIKPWPNRNVTTIKALNDSLKKQGVLLVFVPVPNKEDIYSDILTGIIPRIPSMQRTRLLNKLGKYGIFVIDIAPVFRSHKSTILYYPEDTHWNQDGIILAADTIAAALRRVLPSGATMRYGVKDTSVHKIGDLRKLCCGDEAKYYRRTIFSEVFPLDSALLSDSAASEIIVIGDSFMQTGKEFNAHVGAHLARFLSRPVKTVCSLNANAGGPAVITRAVARSKNPVKIVVWVFTSRALDTPFSSATSKGAK